MCAGRRKLRDIANSDCGLPARNKRPGELGVHTFVCQIYLGLGSLARMGMWDETCGITHLPIFGSDKCVVVVGDRTPFRQPGVVFNWVDLSMISRIEKGSYDRYGWLDDVEGAYDDSSFHLFFHREVWDHIVERGDAAFLEPSRRFLKDPAGVDPAALLELRKVLRIADLTRRDVLVCERFHGVQDLDSMSSYALVHQLTGRQLDVMSKRKSR